MVLALSNIVVRCLTGCDVPIHIPHSMDSLHRSRISRSCIVTLKAKQKDTVRVFAIMESFREVLGINHVGTSRDKRV